MAKRLKKSRRNARSLPTWHALTVFRSRTEARWALFWDELGIRWEYEPEGFALRGGRFYLPDFWLPDVGCWVEIKPETGPNADERRNAVQLVEESGRPLLLLNGAPWPRVFEMLQRVECDGEVDVQAHQVCWTAKYAGTKEIPPHKGRPRMYFDPSDDELERDSEIVDAMAKARAAEFEEPPAEAYASLDLIGTPIVDGEEWERGAESEQNAEDDAA